MTTTVMTGAGASRPLGYPTTTEFFPDAPHFSPEQREVFARLQEHLGAVPLDVEDVLGLLQPIETFMATAPGRFVADSIVNDWQNKTERFTTYTRERCFELYGKLPERDSVAAMYGMLLEVLGCNNARPVTLVTTNYDPVTDVVAEIAQEASIRCFDGFGATGLWSPVGYGASGTGLEIYRLHGSMSWILQGDRVRNTRDYSLRRGDTEHLLIYPGYKGNPVDESQEIYRYCHEAFVRVLAVTDVLISIGFSFRDAHINEAVRQAMLNPALRLIVVNPEWPSGLEGVLGGSRKSFGDRVVHVKGRFGEPDTLLRLAEQFRRVP